MVIVKDKWERLFERDLVASLEARLPAFLVKTRWFGGKARLIESARVIDTIPLHMDRSTLVMAFIEVSYSDGGNETYTMPLSAAFDEEAARLEQTTPEAVIMQIAVSSVNGERQGLVQDALLDEVCAGALLAAIRQEARFPGDHGTLIATANVLFRKGRFDMASAAPSVMKAEQSNTSVKFGSHAIMKLYRRAERGVNPDLEIGRALTARKFPHSPTVLGAFEYVRPDEEPATIAILHSFIENQGNGWQYTLKELQRAMDLYATDQSAYDQVAGILGRRTAELHLALAEGVDDPAFLPERCTAAYWQSVRDRISHSIEMSLTLLRNRLADLGKEDGDRATHVLDMERTLVTRFDTLIARNPDALRIRCHGDYHLGQVLYTGGDFIIIDFEGEPARSLVERRAKQVPMVDVAGMVRSFHYAAYVSLGQRLDQQPDKKQPSFDWEQWAQTWYRSSRAAFLTAYGQVAEGASFWPMDSEERNLLLDVYLIEKAFYELAYELNNRPAWAGIPLRGILQLIESNEDA
jgi:trehalose synthase-fused probable maltokinase